MKKILLRLLPIILILSLAGCADDGDLQSPIIIDSTSPTATPEPVTPSIDPFIPGPDDSLPPKEGMKRSRLTNEWVDEDIAASRPIAVMTPNEINAIPHYNLSKASVIYEAKVEGNMTRMMAIYEDWENLDKIGNIRSLRSYFAYWSFEWDAFIVHFGGPYFIDDLLAAPTTENINGNLGSDDAAFFRTADRISPHNAYASGSGLAAVIDNKNYSRYYRDLVDDHHFQFAATATPNTLSQYNTNAYNATYIDMSGSYPLTRCYFEYNESDGLYYRSQHLSGGTDGPHIDAATNEQLSFKNILIQNVKVEDLGLGYLAMQCHDTTRDGWFFTNGRGIHVTWEKTSDYGSTKYYDDYGNEIILNTGKTMICIIEEGDTFTYR